MKRESRTLIVGDLEIRQADGDAADGAFRVRGHALTFNDPYPVFDFMEQFAPESVPDDIQDRDVFAFWSHDSSRPLARTKNGTLTLAKDDVGLAVEFELGPSRAQEAEAIRTGLVDKMSVGFYVRKQTWEIDDDGNAPDLRTILDAEIIEVSPVAIPANPNTDLSERDLAPALEARSLARAELEMKAEAEEAVKRAEREARDRRMANRLRLAEASRPIDG